MKHFSHLLFESLDAETVYMVSVPAEDEVGLVFRFGRDGESKQELVIPRLAGNLLQSEVHPFIGAGEEGSLEDYILTIERTGADASHEIARIGEAQMIRLTAELIRNFTTEKVAYVDFYDSGASIGRLPYSPTEVYEMPWQPSTPGITVLSAVVTGEDGDEHQIKLPVSVAGGGQEFEEAVQASGISSPISEIGNRDGDLFGNYIDFALGGRIDGFDPSGSLLRIDTGGASPAVYYSRRAGTVGFRLVLEALSSAGQWLPIPSRPELLGTEPIGDGSGDRENWRIEVPGFPDRLLIRARAVRDDVL